MLVPNFFGAQAEIADHLVVNELSTGSSASAYDDWAEIYNPTADSVTLDGWSLQKVTSGGTITRTDLSGTVPAGGYFLVVRDNASTDPDLAAMADLSASNFGLADNNGLYLVEGNSSIDPDDPLAAYTDLVGWGGIAYGEGAVYPENVGDGKSLGRSPDGDDTNDNAVDFEIFDTPTPVNSKQDSGQDLGGEVLLTITPDAVPVQSITGNSAAIVFQANADATANVEYGLDAAYGSASADIVVTANTGASIVLTGLACDTAYHYRINADDGAGGTDQTADASFSTLPCGLSVDSLVMTRSGARANGDYAQGWEWEFGLTVWDAAETTLKMKFMPWSGAAALPAGGNMRYSVDSGAAWIDITADDTYPAAGADISAIDESADPGRQVSVLVQMKVPQGTLAGHYGSSYSILTE